MIEISTEIMTQIQRSVSQDSRYFIKILKRIDPKIKEVMKALVNLQISLQDICTIFCHYCENGLDNFVVQGTKTTKEIFKEIEETNELVADYITYCDFSQADRLVTLAILYRIFESELEIRKLQ